ncbi:MAG: ABC transporter permease [Oscillospiraceae bacterium]|nr:ABC transporter permease [Oscillospiraceae bacterium]
MFKTLLGLAFEGIRRRKRQSLLIFLVLLISFTFAIILLSYTTSIAETNTQLRLDTYGSWYGAIMDGVDSDLEYLESEDWVDEVGVSVNYGTASVTVSDSPVGSVEVGTVNDALTDMGITLESGKMPTSSSGIAIEAATLEELNCGLGGKITLQFVLYDEYGIFAMVERDFKIVGVINEYTRLWDVDSTLNNAIISEEAMEDILAEAKGSLAGSEIANAETTYFFTVNSTDSNIESLVNKFLYQSREGLTVRTVTINQVVGMETEAAQTNLVYLWLVLAITILAVVMIYILQMQVEVRRIVRFRSIGGSKGQLRVLILIETLMLAIPAVLFGILLGFLGIKALLAVNVYSGSTEIIVSIPWNYLGMALALWIAGILLVRMITFQVALATPLTGRMGIQRSKNRVVVGFRRVLVMLMATLLCVSVIFTTVNIGEPLSEYNYWTSRWSYFICEKDNGTNLAGSFQLPDLSEYKDQFLSAPGISDFVGMNRFYALVGTDESDTTSSAVVITMDWDDVQKFADTTGVDQKAYESGESVIVQVVSGSRSETNAPAESSDMTIYIDYEKITEYHSSSPFYRISPVLTSSSLESDGLVSVNVNAGAVQVVESDETLVSVLEYDRAGRYSLEGYTYYVICSLPVLQNLVDQIPEGTRWYIEDESFFKGQQEVGYTQAFLFTTMNAGDLASDAAVSSIMDQIVYARDVGAKEIKYLEYCQLYNFLEVNHANAEVYQQSLIMIIISGACIAIVVLLILVSTLRLETESEKKRYGILQAIGMSRRQRNIELARRAIIRSVIAISAAVVSYLAYYLLMNISAITAGESAVSVPGTMFAKLAGYGLTTPVLLGILAIAFIITFAICFGSKLGINKYSIMEMLREDR